MRRDPPQLLAAGGARTLGYGTRIAVWVEGCTLACDGCASRDTWDPRGGTSVSVADLAAEVIDRSAGLDGLTLTGGEPLQQAPALAELVAAVRGGVGATASTSSASPASRSPWPAGRAPSSSPPRRGGRRPLPGRRADPAPRGSANQRVHLLTPLAEARYGDLDTQGRPPLQFELTGAGVELIGVPRPGELDGLERALGAGGLTVEGASWR